MEKLANPPAICPKCKYRRKAVEDAPDYECPECGVIYSKYVAITPTKPTSNYVKKNDDSFHIFLYKIIFCLSIGIVAEPAFPVRSLLGLGRLLGFEMDLFGSFVFRVILLAIIFGFFVFKTGLHQKLPTGKVPSLMLVASTICVMYINYDNSGIASLMVMLGMSPYIYMAFTNTLIAAWNLISIGYVFKLLAERRTGGKA